MAGHILQGLQDSLVQVKDDRSRDANSIEKSMSAKVIAHSDSSPVLYSAEHDFDFATLLILISIIIDVLFSGFVWVVYKV